MSIEDNLQEPLLEPVTSSPEGSPDPELASKKRKRAADGQTAAAKAKKKVKKQKQPRDEDETIDAAHGINMAFAQMDSQLISDYLAQKTARFERDLSSIELEERYLSANFIRDTTDFAQPRSLDNLPAFLEKYAQDSSKLWTSSKKKGAPHTVIVASAGLRAADIARAVRKFQTKDATVAKLFAKHIKLKDTIKFLKNTKTGMAVGTPARLQALVDDGALSLENLQRVVIDASHVDVKKRGILEMKETQIPLLKWLNSEPLKERYVSTDKHVDLLFF